MTSRLSVDQSELCRLFDYQAYLPFWGFVPPAPTIMPFTLASLIVACCCCPILGIIAFFFARKFMLTSCQKLTLSELKAPNDTAGVKVSEQEILTCSSALFSD